MDKTVKVPSNKKNYTWVVKPDVKDKMPTLKELLKKKNIIT